MRDYYSVTSYSNFYDHPTLNKLFPHILKLL
uniref:Uncharacterized protein n=1 Tax=Siphoviridae sp. ctnPP24 TaxID=2825662 RepID=A0A8S5TYW9_9CAUD|nr:MAG TPA: hypothetical protein [Siphoviridae sp. ctnPP24]